MHPGRKATGLEAVMDLPEEHWRQACPGRADEKKKCWRA